MEPPLCELNPGLGRTHPGFGVLRPVWRIRTTWTDSTIPPLLGSWCRAPFTSQHRRQDPPRCQPCVRRWDDLPHLGASATAVYLKVGPFNGATVEDEAFRLVNNGRGVWSGFVPGAADGTEYKFYIVGTGSKGYKRDPYARELSLSPPFPKSNCVVRRPDGYPWHDQDFQMPAFRDLVVYQFHIGVYYAADSSGNDARRKRPGTFLDVVDRLEYLADLGVNAIEPLPVIEFPTTTSQGYNYTDYFSPEMDYTLPPAPTSSG